MEQRKTDKLTDKAFARLIATSILGILVCLVCLCGASWAWFTDSVPSSSNEIKTASGCDLTVSVYKEDNLVATADVKDSVTIDCAGEYTVTLDLPRDSASGYLVLSVGNVDYYTDFLRRSDENDQKLTFTLKVETSQSVTFTARWGIYSDAQNVITNDMTLTIPTPSTQEP